MKRLTAMVMVLGILFSLTACGTVTEKGTEEAPAGSSAVELPDGYASVIELYQAAISEKWTVEQCMDGGVNYLLGLSQYETAIGYTVKDLDGDGTDELLIATLPGAVDALSQKLIYDLYTQKDGEVLLVFGSLERNRLYWLGKDLFANIGSNGWNDSVNTTLQFGNTSLTDLQIPAEESQFVQLELIPLSKK